MVTRLKLSILLISFTLLSSLGLSSLDKSKTLNLTGGPGGGFETGGGGQLIDLSSLKS